jgi:hypothetical protein
VNVQKDRKRGRVKAAAAKRAREARALTRSISRPPFVRRVDYFETRAEPRHGRDDRATTLYSAGSIKPTTMMQPCVSAAGLRSDVKTGNGWFERKPAGLDPMFAE